MSTYAPINENYMVGEDSSAEFFSPVLDLRKPLRAINYQVYWAEGVSGLMVWEATIYSPSEDLWEQIVNCEGIELEMGPTGGHAIISLTGVWLTVGFVRMRWDPIDSGSAGLVDVAIRIVPI